MLRTNNPPHHAKAKKHGFVAVMNSMKKPSEDRTLADHTDESRSAFERSLAIASRSFRFDVPFPISRRRLVLVKLGSVVCFRSLQLLPTERGIRALQGVVACCWSMVCEQHLGSTFVKCWCARAHVPADQIVRLPPSGIVRRYAASPAYQAGAGYYPARGCWYGSRTRNFQIHNLVLCH